ncbi:MAG: alpha/beta hydrolase [Gammaproteobacteria bacterium TMED104]|nr:MAG: alpha/beta hydrolase [Gammaproteobacteria bacterium TMED104]
MFNTEDEYRSLNLLNVPVLAVWGTNDQVTSFSGSNRLLEVIPSTNLKIIEGGGHNITFVQPTKIGKMIVSFLEEK